MTTTTTTSTFKVDAATSYSNSLAASNVGKKGSGTNAMGMTDYLSLMTAQLKFQDPFEPMDNTQMVAQMAQLSQVTATQETNTKLDNIADALSGQRLSDAASWIGKSMLVKSSTVAADGYGQYSGQVTLSADSAGLSVDLVDSAGSVVKTIDMGAQKAGDASFYWNGKNDAGEAVNAGTLSIRVRGGTGQTAAWSTIAAVQSPSSGANATLVTTLGNFKAADALSIG